jgi:hypothetical protein
MRKPVAARRRRVFSENSPSGRKIFLTDIWPLEPEKFGSQWLNASVFCMGREAYFVWKPPRLGGIGSGSFLTIPSDFINIEINQICFQLSLQQDSIYSKRIFKHVLMTNYVNFIVILWETIFSSSTCLGKELWCTFCLFHMQNWRIGRTLYESWHNSSSKSS